MSLYRYEAVDRSGKVVHGAMNAADERQVADRLSAMGYSARAVFPVSPQSRQSSRVASAGTATGSAPATGIPVSVRSCVGADALARFFRQMATLVRSGISVNQALHETLRVTRNRRLASAVRDLCEATSTGQSLSSAMTRHGSVFPVHAVASVWAGELTGKLDQALEEIASDFEKEASDLRYGRIGWTIAKLNLIAFAFIYPAADINILLSPIAETAAAPGGGSGEAQQILLLVFESFVREVLWKSVLAVAALSLSWIAWGRLKRVAAVKRFTDALLLVVPLWGNLHRYRALGRFLHVLDGLYAAGVNPAVAWDAASLTPRNSRIAEQLRLARRELPRDAKLSDTLAVSGLFPADVVSVVASGERAGSIPATLANLSGEYADRAAALAPACRTASVSLLVAWGLALGGWATIRLVASYFDFVFRITGTAGN